MKEINDAKEKEKEKKRRKREKRKIERRIGEEGKKRQGESSAGSEV